MTYFFGHLFAIAPGIRGLFPASMHAQRQRLYSALRAMASRADPDSAARGDVLEDDPAKDDAAEEDPVEDGAGKDKAVKDGPAKNGQAKDALHGEGAGR